MTLIRHQLGKLLVAGCEWPARTIIRIEREHKLQGDRTYIVEKANMINHGRGLAAEGGSNGSATPKTPS